MSNVYQYGMHHGVTPPLIVVDETCQQTGLDDLIEVSMILLGQPFIPTRGKFNLAVRGTKGEAVLAVWAAKFSVDMSGFDIAYYYPASS